MCRTVDRGKDEFGRKRKSFKAVVWSYSYLSAQYFIINKKLEPVSDKDHETYTQKAETIMSQNSIRHTTKQKKAK